MKSTQLAYPSLAQLDRFNATPASPNLLDGLKLVGEAKQEGELHHMRDGAVVLYRRDRSKVWQVRFKLFDSAHFHIGHSQNDVSLAQASAGSGKRNVCTGFTFTLCAGGTAPTPTTPVTVKIIDGSSGGGTILWQSNITMPAAAGGIVSINRSNLWLVGTADRKSVV